ncbi:MAG: hypothetical protein ACT4P6_11350 [Gemmatimonadaceae bacterium]
MSESQSISKVARVMFADSAGDFLFLGSSLALVVFALVVLLRLRSIIFEEVVNLVADSLDTGQKVGVLDFEFGSGSAWHC